MRIGLLLALSGCWVSDRQIQDRVDDLGEDSGDTADSDLPDLVFTAVTPDYGSNAGGFDVVLAVSGAVEGVEVTFAGATAEIIRVEADAVTVRAPSVGVVGAVDLKVQSEGRSATLPRGFTYWKDGKGQEGLVGYIANFDFDRDYLDEAPRYREAELYFVEPTSYDYVSEFAGGVDKCELDYIRPGASPNRIQPGIPSLRLDNGVERVDAAFDDESETYSLGQDTFWFAPGRSVSLDVAAGADGWPAFVLEDFVTMPGEGFRVVDPDADISPAYVGRTFNLGWAGGQRGDVVLVLMHRRGLQGEVVDELSCVLADDGNHTIPDLWSDWIPFQQIDVYVGRVKRGSGVLPYNRAGAGVVAVHWWYGALFTDF